MYVLLDICIYTAACMMAEFVGVKFTWSRALSLLVACTALTTCVVILREMK
jgi:hypothetical protein